MTTITAEAIRVSRNADDPNPNRKIATLRLTMPRCILAEFNTHRDFSRNAASSRAIPIDRMIESIRTNPFIPVYWGANQKGMSADKECSAQVELANAIVGPSGEFVDRETAWLFARDNAIQMAQSFAESGYHKQLVNRLLEPWMHTKVIVTSTEWDNFFALRIHESAEPHMRLLAIAIRDAIDAAPVHELRPGDWHIPMLLPHEETFPRDLLLRMSVARCASVSYQTVDGLSMEPERATALYSKLRDADPPHMSPFEHQAEADSWFDRETGWLHRGQHRNFCGFRQHRAILDSWRVK